MGGGGGGGTPRYPYPKWVWSPSGWWPHPRNWKINTAVVIFGIILINVPIAIFAERRQECIINLAEVDRQAEERRREILAERAQQQTGASH